MKTTKTIRINHFRTGQPLYEGAFHTTAQAVEAAISERVSLAFADLRHANLINAELDGAILDSAQLGGANLMGANLSEASLRRTCFQDALLHSTVLCDSIIENADFDGALFGATDVAGARLRHCLFTTLSAFDINFNDAAVLDANRFRAAQDYLCRFSRPPLVIKGLRHIVACLDHKMLIGFHALAPESPDIPAHTPLQRFIQSHDSLLQELWSAHNSTPLTLRAA
ncbi:MAG TPA: pentapeptide repeat-containing protein [Micavibrio sp.]